MADRSSKVDVLAVIVDALILHCSTPTLMSDRVKPCTAGLASSSIVMVSTGRSRIDLTTLDTVDRKLVFPVCQWIPVRLPIVP